MIPAIIKRMDTATREGLDEVVLWGDGSPTREFLYVDDAAEGIVLATERYDGAEPVNLGSGGEIAIRELAPIIAKATGFRLAIGDVCPAADQSLRLPEGDEVCSATNWERRRPPRRGRR